MLKNKRKKYCTICYWLKYAPDSAEFMFKNKRGRPTSSIKRFKTMRACMKYLRANNDASFQLMRVKYTAKGRFIVRSWDVTP